MDHHPVLDNIFQSGAETLNQPFTNTTNANKMSINFQASVQHSSQGTHHINSSWKQLNTIQELMTNIINPDKVTFSSSIIK